MDRSNCSHARPTAAQKIVLHQATARKVLPWNPKETLQTRSNKKNPQKQSALTVEANCSPTWPNGDSPFTEVSHDARPRRRPQQGNGSRPGKPEPVTFYQTFLPSSVCTAGEPSVHRLALRAICTPTNRPSLPPPSPGLQMAEGVLVASWRTNLSVQKSKTEVDFDLDDAVNNCTVSTSSDKYIICLLIPVWHSCDLEIWSTSLKMIWRGKP